MATRKISGKDPGKWAEGEAAKWLERMSVTYTSFAYHRYPDARSARGALSAQPADFLIGWDPHDTNGPLTMHPVTVHLEVKETAEANRLPKAKIGQYGKLLMFHLAGFKTIILVYRSAYGDWTYFTGDHLFEGERMGASFPWVKSGWPDADKALDTALREVTYHLDR